MADPAPLVNEILSSLITSAEELHAKLHGLHPPLEDATELCGATKIQDQVKDLTKCVKQEQVKPWGTAQLQPQLLTQVAIDDHDARQAALLGAVQEVQAMQDAVAAFEKQLTEKRWALEAGMKAADAWAGLRRLSHNRWHNGSARSPLLALPHEVLRIVLQKSGKEARFICTSTRTAYGAAGQGLRIPATETDHFAHLEASTKKLDRQLAQWPHPEGVTHIRSDIRLSDSTCRAISALFPRLQELTLPSTSVYQFFEHLLPGNATRLTVPLTAMQKPSHMRAFSSLRALNLAACSAGDVRRMDALGALSKLTALSSLTLSRDGVRIDSFLEQDEPEMWSKLGLWGVLAALPRLARLHLLLWMNYHTEMPEVAPLAELTHLEMECEGRMVQHDQRRGVQVPLLQVLRPHLLPALVSLQLHRAACLLSTYVAAEVRTSVAQAVRKLGLQHLEVTTGYTREATSSDNLAPFLSPSLLTFTTDVELQLMALPILHLLPLPLPLRSLSIALDCKPSVDLQGAVDTLGQQLPQLTCLSITRCNYDKGNTLEPLTGLSKLSRLQHLSLAKKLLVQRFAPVLSTLPALTRLALTGQALNTSAPGALATLTRLRSLWIDSAIQAGSEQEVMHAVRRMRGLTELVLGGDSLRDCSPGWVGELVPPPVMLRRLMMASEQMLPAAVRALGQYVDHIGLLPAS